MTPFLKSLRVQNYRALDDVTYDDLRWVNVIGGLNGAGKSTLLEAIFTFLDGNNVFPILRPLLFRSLPGDYNLARSFIFRDHERPIRFSAETRNGKFDAQYKWEKQNLSPTTTSPDQFRHSPAETISFRDGVTGTAWQNGKQILQRHYAGDATGLMIRDDIEVNAQAYPMGAYLSRVTILSPEDNARRFSLVVQRGRKQELLSIVKSINPDIHGLELLQFGNQTIMHAEVSSGSVIPISFVGDGALNLIAVAMAIMEAENGVILLDEFDAAVHYSKLDFTWNIVRKLSQQYNCQVFAATHSRESIFAAASVFPEGSKDFSYTRMSSIGGSSRATRYNQSEIKNAVDDGWEIR